MSDEKIVIDWIKPEEKSKAVVIKQSMSIFWKILKIIFIFLLGYFCGVLSAYFIYHH